ncbi:MAG: hypothetical protein HONBIEJF_00417 [Fimbriimonadaceae bacterium]|nr:hypothetical protein [Fimbriimonadaceae bacterium]
MFRSVILAALLPAAAAAQWSYYEKLPDGSGLGYISQEFPDYPGFTTASFDDIVLNFATPVWDVTIYGVEHGQPEFNEGVFLGVGSAPGFDAIDRIYTGTYDQGNLHFDVGDIFFPGKIWLSAWVKRSFGSGGQWFWLVNSRDVDWSESYGHNPGGEFGRGTDPFPWSEQFGVPADMALSFRYVVPEPATLAALAIGLAALRRTKVNRRDG